jgi:hypothetical protein
VDNYTSLVSIKLLDPIQFGENITYTEKCRILASEDRILQIYHKSNPLFNIIAFKNIHNSLSGPVAAKMVELIVNNHIMVKDKEVIDLGCGSGIIGLTAAQKGAKKIIFTDINKNAERIKEQSMFRVQDEIIIQDLLLNQEDDSCDMVIALMPTDIVQKNVEIDYDSYKCGITCKPDLLFRIIKDSSRVLRKQGELIIWFKISHLGIISYHNLIMEIYKFFDISTINILAYDIEENMSNIYNNPKHKLTSSCVILSVRT